MIYIYNDIYIYMYILIIHIYIYNSNHTYMGYIPTFGGSHKGFYQFSSLLFTALNYGGSHKGFFIFHGQVYVYVFFSTSAILSLLVASELH